MFRKGRSKLSLFADDMILNIENLNQYQITGPNQGGVGVGGNTCRFIEACENMGLSRNSSNRRLINT